MSVQPEGPVITADDPGTPDVYDAPLRDLAADLGLSRPFRRTTTHRYARAWSYEEIENAAVERYWDIRHGRAS